MIGAHCVYIVQSVCSNIIKQFYRICIVHNIQDVTLSILLELIPEAVPSQKCHMKMGPVLSGDLPRTVASFPPSCAV